MNISFVTSNPKKVAEAQIVIPQLQQLDIDLPELQEFDARTIIEAKLEEALKQHNEPLIVEDTGLYLDCLDGLPGPLIKWFITKLGPQGLYELAAKLGNTNAQARTTIGYAAQGKIQYFEGIVCGTLVPPAHTSAFGWDPIFLPNGYAKTYAHMSTEEKCSMSHRTKALEKLKEFLEQKDHKNQAPH